jgi:nucleoside-diphosphate-sugar epimerase
MKYFVTGATGFLGGVVVRELLSRGHQVNAVVRDPGRAAELKKLGTQVFRGDVTDKSSMLTPMQGMDGIFHIAGWYKIGTRDKTDGEKVNIQGTRNVLELMRELDIPKGVYTSTLAVNSDTHGKLVDESYRFSGKHLSEYDRTKAAAHDLAQKMIAVGLRLVIVMPGIIYGPGDTSNLRINIIDYLKRKLPALPARTAYSWGYVDDIAHGHLLAMEKGKLGESYIIAGETHTLAEAFNLAKKVTGIPVPMKLPVSLVKGMSALMSIVDKITPVPETYTAEGLRVIAGVTYTGDNSKARRELGYSPRPFSEGWAETFRHEMLMLGI